MCFQLQQILQRLKTLEENMFQAFKKVSNVITIIWKWNIYLFFLVFHSSMKYCIIQYYSFQLAVNLFVQSTLWYSTGIESNYRTLLPTPYPGMGSTPHSRPTCCPEIVTIHQTHNVKRYPKYPQFVLTDFPGQENKT